MHRFTIDLSDVDRGVYESLDLRVAQHPSESERRMITRVIAYCLQHEEGIEFGRGLSTSEDPALCVKNLRGEMTLWVDVGTPQPERLHRAMKSVGRVAVYTSEDPSTWLRDVERATVHKKESLEIWSLPDELVETIEAHLSRTTKMSVTVSDGRVYVEVAGYAVDAAPVRRSPAPLAG